MKWPGGREQTGYVPPHQLIGLREGGASSDYMNFSWCLVCGQIQGDWPTEAGVRHLIKYAEKRYWEVIMCHEDGTWMSAYFLAKTEEQIQKRMETVEFRKIVHYHILDQDTGEQFPDDCHIEELD